MNLKNLITISSTLVLCACTIHTKHIGGTYEPSLATNYTGILSIELSEDLSDVLPTMKNICNSYDGFKLGSANRVESPVGWKGMGNTYWQYQCNGFANRNPQRFNQVDPNSSSISQPIKAPITKPAASVEQVRQTCRELGFKEGTEAFAECGLKLIRN